MFGEHKHPPCGDVRQVIYFEIWYSLELCLYARPMPVCLYASIMLVCLYACSNQIDQYACPGPESDIFVHKPAIFKPNRPDCLSRPRIGYQQFLSQIDLNVCPDPESNIFVLKPNQWFVQTQNRIFLCSNYSLTPTSSSVVRQKGFPHELLQGIWKIFCPKIFLLPENYEISTL